jgi:hypothetical protein
MAVPGSASVRQSVHPTVRSRRSERSFHRGDVTAFLSAGAVLFASLVVGATASLIVGGANELVGAILEGFLKLGLWTFAGFIVAIVAALVAAARSA